MEYPYFMKINSCMKFIYSQDCLSYKLIIEYTTETFEYLLNGDSKIEEVIRKLVLPYNPNDKR